MGRFLSGWVFFLIGTGLLLHFRIEVPYITSWLGSLPGDLTLTKGKAIIELPLTSSALCAAVLALLRSS
jgi:hypothetical protein